MPSTRILKRRITSAKSIAQITKAMEMVAASKMKRSQEQALLSRAYSQRLLEVMADLAERVAPELHPLLGSLSPGQASPQNRGVILVGPDKGLCGGLVTNLGKELADLSGAKFVAVGKKGKNLVRKINGQLIAYFELGLARPDFEFVIPIAKMVTDSFTQGEFTEVLMVYTRFESTLSQRPTRQRLLPISLLRRGDEAQIEYLFEPSPDEVLEALLSHYIETVIYQVLLEATASEHSARMVAMKNAHENATEIVDGFQLIFNEARQQQITREIADVVTAKMALD